MAKCKKCGREIAEGTKYCKSCKELRDHKGKSWIKWIVSVVVIVGGGIAYVVSRGKVKVDTSKWV